MKKVIKSTQFKKDYKRYQNNKKKIIALMKTVCMLANDEPLPKEMCPHMLSGQYASYMECHIGADYLLVWCDKDAGVLKLVRLGSHSEIFG